MKHGREVGLGPGHIKVDWDPAILPQRGTAPICGPCRGQTAGWITMPLGTEVGLGPGNNVIDGDPAPKRGTAAPIFGPCLLRPNAWMDQDATCYRATPRPRPHCVRWGPSPPPQKKETVPNFRPISVVAKWLDGSSCHFVRRYASAQATLC